jgi:hypothetical protein
MRGEQHRRVVQAPVPLIQRLVVGLHYPRAIDNDPLTAPIRVVSVRNNTVQPKDGRVILVDTLADSLDEAIKASISRPFYGTGTCAR